MKKTVLLGSGVLVVTSLSLRAQEECPPEKAFAFALTAWDRIPGPEAQVEDVYFVPGTPVTVEVTAWLVTNPSDKIVTVNLCSFFALYAAHDPAILNLEQIDTETTDAGRSFFVEGLIDDEGPQRGFLAGTPFCLGYAPVEFTGSLSLVRAAYTLAAPHDMAGKLITTEVRFEDQLGDLGAANGVLGKDGRHHPPCLRSLELRFHVAADSSFIRGDANFDGRIDVSDAVTILRALFDGDAPIRCSDAADANDEGRVDISDAVYVFAYLFLGGPTPPAPFPLEGADPTADELHCIEHS